MKRLWKIWATVDVHDRKRRWSARRPDGSERGSPELKERPQRKRQVTKVVYAKDRDEAEQLCRNRVPDLAEIIRIVGKDFWDGIYEFAERGPVHQHLDKTDIVQIWKDLAEYEDSRKPIVTRPEPTDAFVLFDEVVKHRFNGEWVERVKQLQQQKEEATV